MIKKLNILVEDDKLSVIKLKTFFFGFIACNGFVPACISTGSITIGRQVWKVALIRTKLVKENEPEENS